jgi:hypothetical protein
MQEIILQHGKATYDTAQFVKEVVDTQAITSGKIKPNNVIFTQNKLTVTGHGLNLVIPLYQASEGQKEWDEAIAKGFGDVAQDILIDALLTAGYIIVVGSNPVGWAAVGLSAVALSATWASSLSGKSLGKVIENDFDLSNTMNDLLNGTPTTAALPGLDSFDYLDPNDPNNFDPNDGNNLNTDDGTDTSNPDDGIPPIDPTPPRRDPLVLDTDKDGFISTVALADSNTYFDITGDGIKEKVSWIGANDGILTCDKNENGKIDGIDEVFGNLTTSGFDELKQLIDSNYDGVIDRRDELFNRLQIWHDTNGDGMSQTDELVSLKEEGIKSINANNVLTTDIELGGATLSEASKYTDSEGNKELVADINLEYNPLLTTIDTTTIPDYSIDLDTLTLPNLRGYGLFLNSFISYNINDSLKAKAQELVTGVESMSSGFTEFIEIWSGYTEYVNGVKEKFNISGDIGLSELDKKVWIIDRLFGRNTNATAIETNFEKEMKEFQSTTVISKTSSSVTIDFQKDYYNNYFQKEILDRYEGAFALQAFYKFDGAHYDAREVA